MASERKTGRRGVSHASIGTAWVRTSIGIGLILLVGCATGCARDKQIVYKCPEGQVKVIENRGTAAEATRCYTPGVMYSDWRPLTMDTVVE